MLRLCRTQRPLAGPASSCPLLLLAVPPAAKSAAQIGCRAARRLRRPCLQQRRRYEGGPRKRTVLRGKLKSDDPWTLLGVPRSASEADVKKAYLQLAKECHPDAPGGDEVKFKKVKEAYDLIKSGKAAELYPEYAPPGPRPSDVGNMSGDRWAKGFAGFQQPPGAGADMRYSSSQTSYDGRGGFTTTYTYRDSNGQQFTYTEYTSSDQGTQDFWEAFRQAHVEAVKQEGDRLRARAAERSPGAFEELFNNWEHHRNQQSADYARYVQERDRAVYRFVFAWLLVFFMLRLLLNIFV